MIFLLEYDRSRGELLSIQLYPDSDRRLAQNAGLEREIQLHRDGIQREVVLLQAENEVALRKTHRHYFEDVRELAAAVARE